MESQSQNLEFIADYDSFSDLQLFHRQTASFKIEFKSSGF